MVGAFVLAMPAMDKKNQADLDLAAAQGKLTSLQTTINQYGDLDGAIEEKKGEIAEVKEKFYSPMPNEDVDSLVKKILLGNNMMPISMEISSQENYPLTPYQPQATQTQGTTEEGATTSSGLTLITVNVSFSGSLANLSNMIDQIANLDAYQAGSLTYDAENVENPITMTFKLFVI